MRLAGGITAYRIGWTTNRKWWHPHRPWQAESDSGELRFCRRAFTPRAAERKMARDEARHGKTSYQQWRTWRKQTLAPTLCRAFGHRAHRVWTGPVPRHYPPSAWCGRCLADLPDTRKATS